jgi:hydroxyethylthiazole kinase-like uncharacterized protein yjeF
MTGPDNQILSVEQMRAAEQALIDGGSSVDDLMQLAGTGAAEWAWRLAWPRPATVLCGPGNNGGDGYVIAETLRHWGLDVAVVAPLEPKTDAAANARAAYQGPVLAEPDGRHGGTLVDCLFGSGLARGLSDDLLAILRNLAASHPHRVAVDLPSGVESDSGRPLNEGLPDYDLTIALGAWKFAHWLMPASAKMGVRRLVPIGVAEVSGAARLLAKPHLAAPAPDAHKYSRGLVAVIAGNMPGATLLACRAAMHGGAGYVKLGAPQVPVGCPAGLVVDSHARSDPRLAALLIGPGLGRTGERLKLLREILHDPLPMVLDADAVVMLQPDMLAGRTRPTVVTPHAGELAILAGAFGIEPGNKVETASRLAAKSGLIVVAKGPDTVIAAPDGRVAIAPPAPSWLSTAGTGDVLAGIVVSRLAAGADAFEAACEAVWLHGEAARRAGVAFAAEDLIHEISTAYSTCL